MPRLSSTQIFLPALLRGSKGSPRPASLQHVLGLLWGILPVGLAWSISLGRHPKTGAQTTLADSSMWRSRGSTVSSSWVRRLLTLSLREHRQKWFVAPEALAVNVLQCCGGVNQTKKKQTFEVLGAYPIQMFSRDPHNGSVQLPLLPVGPTHHQVVICWKLSAPGLKCHRPTAKDPIKVKNSHVAVYSVLLFGHGQKQQETYP